MRVLFACKEIHRIRLPGKWLTGLIVTRHIAHCAADCGETQSTGCAVAFVSRDTIRFLGNLILTSICPA